MDFTLQTVLTIRGKRYTFVQSRRSPDKIFSDDSGGRATIYKLHCQTTNTFHALKVFKPSLIDAYEYANFAFFQTLLPQMNHFAWVKQRLLLTAEDDAALITEFPQLKNAIIMPWFDLMKLDEIRSNILAGKLTATPKKTRHFAQLLAYTLAELERNQVAHGDIASTNILFDWENDELYIIDIEDMYHASLKQPTSISKGSGTPGYRFNNDFTSWAVDVDRFAGAIMLCEILSLGDNDCNEKSAEESYFTQDDIYKRFEEDAKRFEVLCDALDQQNHKWVQLLLRVWNETNLAKLPALTEWESTLGRPTTYDSLYQHWLRPVIEPPPITIPDQSSSNIPEITAIEIPELVHQIMQSDAYKTAAHGADILLQNALPLLTGNDATIHALETCVLIELLKITAENNNVTKINIASYSKFIKNPNGSTTLHDIFAHYGFQPDMLQIHLQPAIERIAQMDTATLQQRLDGVAHPRFPHMIKLFQTQICQDMDSRTSNNASDSPRKSSTTKDKESEQFTQKPRTEWYTRAADSEYPALFIFLLDLSRSMYKDELKVNGQYRYQIAEDIINDTINALVQKCLKGQETKPRYHVALIGYHKKNANIFQRVAREITYKDSMNNKSSLKADIKAGIYPIGAVERITITNDLINKAIPAGSDMQRYPDGETHMIQAFDSVYDLINAHIKSYWECHPPYVFHITDGANNQDGDLIAAFERLTSLGTAYGNTLVATAYIGDDLIHADTNWSGITSQTVFTNKRAEWAKMLRQISSKMPASFRAAIKKDLNKDIDADAYLFFPGTDHKMISAAITAAVSTGSGTKSNE